MLDNVNIKVPKWTVPFYSVFYLIVKLVEMYATENLRSVTCNVLDRSSFACHQNGKHEAIN